MPNQKLLEVVRYLSTKQCKELQEYVGSSFHNRKYNRTKIQQLLELILNTTSKDRYVLKDKRALNQRFFPKLAYAEKGKNAIDSLASDLFSLVKRYLLYEEQADQRTKTNESLALAKFYRINNCEQRFQQTVQAIRKKLEQARVKDETHFQTQIHLEDEIAIFQSTFNTYVDDSNLINANVALDKYFTIAKLTRASSLLFQQQLGPIDIAESLVLNEAIVQHFENYAQVRTPIAELFYLVVKYLQSSPTSEELQSFLCQALRHEAEIPADRFRNLMAFYRFFVARQYQLTVRGDRLLDKVFELYKEHLDRGYFHVAQQSCLLPSSLKSMVNISIKVGQPDWADDLLRRYPPGKIVGTRFPEEAHRLCVAEVLFAKRKFVEAEEQVVYRNYENVNYSVLADILLIKIYYETDHELLDSRISALSQKVRRSKLAKESKQRYLNFLRLIGQLIKHSFVRPREELKKLATTIQETLPIIEREWLLMKVKQLL